MDNIYETRRLLDEYLLFHYGSATEVLPWAEGPQQALGFAARSVHELLDRTQLPAQALDLGCAVGRSSFELAALGWQVRGMDFSHRFVQAAEALKQGPLPYRRWEQGHVYTDLSAQAPQGWQAGGLAFFQGDAMHLPQDLGPVDLVHAANLLCRLSQPQLLLQRLPDLLRSGGQLLLTTPCTWLAEFTPPQHWPQGSTQDWLKAALGADFELELERDLPFVIREHARKYQWSVAWGTRWRRR